MAIKFRDENGNPENIGKSNTADQRKGSDPMDALRKLLNDGPDGAPSDMKTFDKNAPLPDYLSDSQKATVNSVQARLDLLVEAMNEFMDSRDAADNPGDAMMKLVKFTGLVTETVEMYPDVEVASMLSAGIAAIAAIERRNGR